MEVQDVEVQDVEVQDVEVQGVAVHCISIRGMAKPELRRGRAHVQDAELLLTN